MIENFHTIKYAGGGTVEIRGGLTFCDICGAGRGENTSVKTLNIQHISLPTWIEVDICPTCLRMLADKVEAATHD